jgi:hypothetical protein
VRDHSYCPSSAITTGRILNAAERKRARLDRNIGGFMTTPKAQTMSTNDPFKNAAELQYRELYSLTPTDKITQDEWLHIDRMANVLRTHLGRLASEPELQSVEVRLKDQRQKNRLQAIYFCAGGNDWLNAPLGSAERIIWDNIHAFYEHRPAPVASEPSNEAREEVQAAINEHLSAQAEVSSSGVACSAQKNHPVAREQSGSDFGDPETHAQAQLASAPAYKVRQYQDAYKITHSAVNEMASYLLRGWPECCGKMSIQSWIVDFTEDLPASTSPSSAQIADAILANFAVTFRPECDPRTYGHDLRQTIIATLNDLHPAPSGTPEAFALLETTVKAEREVLVTLRDYIKKQGEKLDAANAEIETLRTAARTRLDSLKGEVERLSTLLADANRGAERNAHVNQGLATKLQESRVEITRLKGLLEEAEKALYKIGPSQPNDGRWWAVLARETVAKITQRNKI